MIVQLPNGLIDGPDLFNFAEIDELRGKQQDYLADKDLVVGNIGHLPKILGDMLLALKTKEGLQWKGNLQEAIYKLPSGDLETLLVKIRENTYGPRFYHEAICSHCNYTNKNLRLDLDKLELDALTPEELSTPKVFILPKSQVNFELKPIYLNDLFTVLKVTAANHPKLITSMVALSLKKLGEKIHVTPQDIENIPASDLQFIQNKLDETKIEGRIDTNIDITCSNCNKDFSIKLNCLDSSFFDPTRDSRSSTI